MSGSHTHDANSIDRQLKISLGLNACFTLFECIVGLLSGSLALLSDSGHNLTDSLSLLISLFANKISQKEADADHSYGHGRITILAALLNTAILIVLSFFIFYEAYQRILTPKSVEGTTIIFVALVGIIVNTTIALILKKNKGDLNVKSAFVNIAFDALALVGTLIGGVFIILTKQLIIDPLISILIGILLLHASYGVAKDAVHVLLEGIPDGLDIEKVKEEIRKTPKVKGVDDMHIWAISSQYAALSCHIVIEDCHVEESIKMVQQIKEELQQKFHIEHATIETELIECPPSQE